MRFSPATSFAAAAVHDPVSGAPVNTVQWGVLGAAAIATGRTIPALRAAPSATLLALASRDAAKARAVAAEFAIPRTYDSYDALLADADVAVVYIPLPNQLHFEWSLRALAAGKHVLCEKPLCLESSQVAALCAERDRSRLRIEEGFGYRNHAQWDKLRALLDAGAIGAVRAVHATLAKQFLDPADVRNNPAGGGGALYDLGSYVISACNLIFGAAPTRVVAALDHDPVFRIDRLSTALLDYAGRHASFTVATQSGPNGWGTHQHLLVLGSSGWLRMNFPFAHARPTACSIEVGNESSVGSFATESYHFEPVNQYLLQVERFSRLVLGHDVPSWPIEDSLTTLCIIEALFASARSGGWQALPG